MLAPYFCRAFFSDNKLLCTGNAVVTDDFQIRKCPQRLQLLHTPNLFYKTPTVIYFIKHYQENSHFSGKLAN